MSSDAKNPKPTVIVKKVSPYPFEGTIEQGGQKKPFSVMKLTTDGMIVRVDKVFVNVGEHYKIYFEIPVSRDSISVQVRVMKTYDKSVNPKVNVIERMAEFRFENLDSLHLQKIRHFIASIGQQP